VLTPGALIALTALCLLLAGALVWRMRRGDEGSEALLAAERRALAAEKAAAGVELELRQTREALDETTEALRRANEAHVAAIRRRDRELETLYGELEQCDPAITRGAALAGLRRMLRGE
jgi:DNA repair exonuclease SbcCD ATPase subunit